MSQEKRLAEALRWLRTAETDLDAALVLTRVGANPQACFLAQQAGEKAVKAIWYRHGLDPWGHSALRLLRELPTSLAWKPSSEHLEAAAALDLFYIPTRYPNGLPDLVPADVYTPADAQRGLEAARILLAEARKALGLPPAAEV